MRVHDRDTTAAPEPGTQDNVGLLELAQAVRAELSGSPEREARLESLARDVRSGQYQVDAKAVSRAIVEDMHESKKRRRRSRSVTGCGPIPTSSAGAER